MWFNNSKMNEMKTIFRNILFVLGIAFLPQTRVVAQALSLDSVLNSIEQNNPMLFVYEAKINALDAYAAGAKSWMPPQAGAGFFMTPYDARMWRAEGGNAGMGSFMLSVEQMFPNRVRQNMNFNYMKSMSRVETESKNYQRNQLLSEAKMNYYEWAVMLRKRTVLRESEELLNLVIQSSEIRYQYNNEKLNSIFKARAQLAELKGMQLMLENEIAQKRIMLNTLMNRDKNIEFTIDTTYTVRNYDEVTIDTSRVSSVRSEIASMQRMIEVNQARQKLERSSRLPEFGLRYDHMFTFGKQPQLFSLMGMVTIPIAPWSSRMWKANIKGLDFENIALQREQQSMANEVAGKLETLRSKISYQKKQLETTDNSILPAMRKNYQVASLAFEQNNGELFVVLDAWQMLKMSQLNRLDQLMELLTLQTEYEKEFQIR